MSKKYAIATGVLVLFLSGTALADTSVYPAAMCQAEHTTSGDRSVGSDGSVYNPDTLNDLELICPIVRPNEADPITSASMYVHDGHTLQTLDCTLRCRDDNAASFYSNSQNTGVPGTTGNYISLNFAVISEYDRGSCYFYCIVPDAEALGSAIVSYRANF